MKITLTINGKPVEATIDDAAFAEATQTENEPRKTGYERAKNGDNYYYLNGPDLFVSRENGDIVDGMRYDSGNYYTDGMVAKENCRADRLMHNLRRFAAEHGGCCRPSVTSKIMIKKFTIYNEDGCLCISGGAFPQAGSVFFETEEAARAAIEAFKDELIWYFTEYDPMLKGWWGD